ncbi:Na,H/K antiporter P-type ATPase, alpha subunit family protein (macronuclear) [Tetrahymena thermophila SB210]|uniref:Na,H/K antiporter P-type ATPase, alpha subunit family protein n=1 Tax=Tetrahymena thermophila (strain SB210) TaxID=312017 RepID=Q22XZ1_TETTS|nr:Na,H/K antiporter P-type ATPase, alpha subunit family protein [Tetrahymena thermophila SB210]EAR90233.2 Na,H/K antiporter P-type ATPase, alpha subunit family protein [Tetrahymena thermophila SB210]|eukprot:XP_001010478.2 Na,H/K antiporter P-type ATPase, alpha subunit family protein [Tetrahymena thermophila SB210]
MQEANQNQCVRQININQDDGNKDAHTNQYSEQNEDQVLNQINQNSNQNQQNNILDQYVDHKISLEELKIKYNTDFALGLTDEQANILLKKHGENKVLPKKKNIIFLFFRQMKNIYSLSLWLCVVLFLVAQIIQPNSSNIYLTIILAIVIFISAAINFQQHSSREVLKDRLYSQFTAQKVDVIRGGQKKQVDPSQLVVGDIIQIKYGQRIPADIRILSSNGMMVDNYQLTGESEPQYRTVECSHPESFLETSNIAFYSTFCCSGSGEGVVVNTGSNNILSIFEQLEQEEQQAKTSLSIEVNRFTIFIFIVAIFLCLLFFLLAFFYSEFNLSESFVFGISILARSTPLGLICCFSISLSIATNSLHDKQVYVKNPQIIETLGSVSCICTNTTGVLTQNIISVHNLYYKGRVYQSKNMVHLQDGETPQYDIQDPDFKILHQAAVLSCEAQFDTSQLVDKQDIDYLNCPAVGSNTDISIIRFYQYIEDINEFRNRHKIAINPNGTLCKIPFTNQMKCSLIIIEEQQEDSYYTVYVKGSPERILSFCSEIILNGQSSQLNNRWREKINAVISAFYRDGQRTLGLARLHLSNTQFPQGSMINVSSFQNLPFNLQNFQFCGLISFRDPPKQGVLQQVQKLRKAGIKVIMITADHPHESASTAKQLNFIPKDILTNLDLMEINNNLSWFEASQQCKAIVVSGVDIVQYIEQSQEENEDEYYYLRQWISKPYCVFCRVFEKQRKQIVEVCQREGYIVAGIGNNYYDFKMIKQAEVGIFINLSDWERNKYAADIILLDNDFSSVVSCIEEGRKIFDNMKKAIFFLFSSNMAEIIPFLSFIIFQIPLPLSNIYMLILSLCNQFLLAISLAYEEAETDLMTRKPRNKTEHLISNKLITVSCLQTGLIASAAGHLGYLIAFNYFGFPVLSLFGLASITGYRSPQNDFGSYINPLMNNQIDPFYNQDLYNITKFDNCNKPQYQEAISKLKYQINWFKLTEGNFDLRKSLVYCDPESGAFQPNINWSYCDINKQQNWSPLISQTACYSTEALNYAQSVYFVTIIFVQSFNIIACKTRSTSFVKSSYNSLMFQGIAFQTVLAIILQYIPGIQTVFGGRPIIFWLWTSCLSITILLLIYEEIRKYCCRKYKWFYKYCYW